MAVGVRNIGTKWVLTFPEQDNLSTNRSLYLTKKSPHRLHKYYQSFSDYLIVCQTYLSGILTRVSHKKIIIKTYSMSHLVAYVFSEMQPHQEREYTYAFAYVAQLYLNELINTLQEGDFVNYEDLVNTLMNDCSWLFCCIEKYIKNNKNIDVPECKSIMSTQEMLRTANKLTFLECQEISQLGCKNVKAYAILLIRQILENTGKSIIGFRQITTARSGASPKFSQISWEFLQMVPNTIIELPLQAEWMGKINKWTHSFVHAGIVHNIFARYYAVKVLNEFYKPATEDVYGIPPRSDIGRFVIKDQAKLWKDFEKYVYGRDKSVTIEKLETSEIKAYIVGPLRHDSAIKDFLRKRFAICVHYCKRMKALLHI